LEEEEEEVTDEKVAHDSSKMVKKLIVGNLLKLTQIIHLAITQIQLNFKMM
jgi:hypothetical protein